MAVEFGMLHRLKSIERVESLCLVAGVKRVVCEPDVPLLLPDHEPLASSSPTSRVALDGFLVSVPSPRKGRIRAAAPGPHAGWTSKN